MTDWINGRRPTEADADPAGNVIARHDGLTENPLIKWSLVTDFCLWRHSPDWTPPIPAIKVGQTWRRADGVEVDVYVDDGTENAPFCIGLTPENAWWYGRNGKTVWVNKPSLTLVELIKDAPEPKPVELSSSSQDALVPRRFVAISRTAHDSGFLIDAIADDGTAWWKNWGGRGWHQFPHLPHRKTSNG